MKSSSLTFQQQLQGRNYSAYCVCDTGRSEHFFKHSRLKFSSLGCVKFDESAVTMTQENASCKWQLFIRKKSDIIAHLLGDGFC
ncbi:hypothetical protein T4C_8812 [Trichinella pseudospiralis]|uniref:Uncharacterized protein n=1 Tax=Trichinella pseudospiralis TaxID=6337 RepID=A0A0V1K509_TRIPS|nr:hypothetical protein T4C_8812 [Trichinella pseudospiralis]